MPDVILVGSFLAFLVFASWSIHRPIAIALGLVKPVYLHEVR
jgi:hypothetical protein